MAMNRKQIFEVLGNAEPESFPDVVVTYLHEPGELSDDDVRKVEGFCDELVKTRPDWAPKP